MAVLITTKTVMADGMSRAMLPDSTMCLMIGGHDADIADVCFSICLPSALLALGLSGFTYLPVQVLVNDRRLCYELQSFSANYLSPNLPEI